MRIQVSHPYRTDKVNFWCKWQQIFPKYHLNRLNSRVDSSDYMLLSLLTIWNLSRFIKICEHSISWFCPSVLKMMYWIWMQGNFDALFAVLPELLLFKFIYRRCKQAHSWHLISSRYMILHTVKYSTAYKSYPHSMEVKVIFPASSFSGHHIQKQLK